LGLKNTLEIVIFEKPGPRKFKKCLGLDSMYRSSSISSAQ